MREVSKERMVTHPGQAEDLVLEKCRAMIGSKTGPPDVYCNRLDPVT